MSKQRERPELHAEEAARCIVRNRYQSATSAYCDEGAALTGEVLGTATARDRAVEAAWQGAVARIGPVP